MLGVDACKAGWVGIALGGGPARAYFAVLIEELVSAAESDGPVEVIAIDIPIGLADSGRRKADEQARAIVGPRRASSVFTTPVRTALEAGDYAAAVAENRRRAGQGISRQAWGLRAKLLQVDHWVRQGGRRVVEVHPEVCFARLADRQLTHSKATWAGVEERRALLSGAGIILTGLLGAAGAKAGVDDVLDAAAAAWTAQRVAVGRALCVPDIPETFSDGIPAAIWA